MENEIPQCPRDAVDRREHILQLKAHCLSLNLKPDCIYFFWGRDTNPNANLLVNSFFWTATTKQHLLLSLFIVSLSGIWWGCAWTCNKEDVLMKVCYPLDSITMIKALTGGQKGCSNSLQVSLAQWREWNNTFYYSKWAT